MGRSRRRRVAHLGGAAWGGDIGEESGKGVILSGTSGCGVQAQRGNSLPQFHGQAPEFEMVAALGGLVNRLAERSRQRHERGVHRGVKGPLGAGVAQRIGHGAFAAAALSRHVD